MKNNWVTIEDWITTVLGAASAVVGVVALFCTPPLWVVIPAAIASVISSFWGIAKLAAFIE